MLNECLTTAAAVARDYHILLKKLRDQGIPLGSAKEIAIGEAIFLCNSMNPRTKVLTTYGEMFCFCDNSAVCIDRHGLEHCHYQEEV